MSAERLFQAIGLVDDDLIEGAAFAPVKKKPVWIRYAAMAACLCLVCMGSFAYLVTGGFHGFGSTAGSSDGAAPGDGGSGIAHDSEPVGVEEAIRFMSYAGPVLPLTTEGNADGITAERHTDWDFAPTAYEDGDPRQWGAVVTDSYTLTNTTDTDVTLPVLYPIAATLSDLGEEMTPALMVNGETVDWDLVVGGYAGGFRDAGVADGSTWNLSYPDSWTDYKALLEDGSYRAAALTGAEGLEPSQLNQPVTVYTFTDFAAPHVQYDAASQTIRFTIDDTRTTVLSCGFNGYGWDEDTGEEIHGYFVPNGIRHDKGIKQLIVLGDDIGEYTLQGYKTGAWDADNELEGVSCTVTRTETTLHEALLALCDSYLTEIRADPDYYAWLAGATDVLNTENYCALVEQMLTEYGLLSDHPIDRYNNSRMDELLHEVLTIDRVLYLRAEVTVPAGETAEVTAKFWKSPSFDFGCSGSEHVGLQGYDYVTTLDSTLEFTSMTASLSNVDGVELTGQNFGFDPENGITEAAPDMGCEHYYLELRQRTD